MAEANSMKKNGPGECLNAAGRIGLSHAAMILDIISKTLRAVFEK